VRGPRPQELRGLEEVWAQSANDAEMRRMAEEEIVELEEVCCVRPRRVDWTLSAAC
jgi:hypothetical protein